MTEIWFTEIHIMDIQTMSMATITIIMIRPRDINTNIPLVMGMEDSTMEDTAEVTMVMRTGLMAMGTQQIRYEYSAYPILPNLTN